MPDQDLLTVTVRLYDPKEKVNAALAASWVTIQVPRSALGLAPADFAAKYLAPAVPQLEHFKVKA